jgi:hypothetical protein
VGAVDAPAPLTIPKPAAIAQPVARPAAPVPAAPEIPPAAPAAAPAPAPSPWLGPRRAQKKTLLSETGKAIRARPRRGPCGSIWTAWTVW